MIFTHQLLPCADTPPSVATGQEATWGPQLWCEWYLPLSRINPWFSGHTTRSVDNITTGHKHTHAVHQYL